MVYRTPRYAESSSTMSASSSEDEKYGSSSPMSPLLGTLPDGSHRVRYQPTAQWDWSAESAHTPLDVSLALPHYRARAQPAHHRMRLYLAAAAPVRAKITRQPVPRTPFFLAVRAAGAPVTLWLPSDFRGRVRHARGARLALSAGFSNHVLPHVRFARADEHEPAFDDEHPEDEVLILAAGKVELRMWDVATGMPESRHKETWRRVFGSSCPRRSSEANADWDFLLEN